MSDSAVITNELNERQLIQNYNLPAGIYANVTLPIGARNECNFYMNPGIFLIKMKRGKNGTRQNV